jgi:hypothetical protein
MEETRYTESYKSKYKFSLLKQRTYREYDCDIAVLGFGIIRVIAIMQESGRIFVEKPQNVILDYEVWEQIRRYCVREILTNAFIPMEK